MQMQCQMFVYFYGAGILHSGLINYILADSKMQPILNFNLFLIENFQQNQDELLEPPA